MTEALDEGENVGIDVHSLPAVLHGDGPDEALADELRRFGQFVGARGLEWRGPGPDGFEIVVPGELHFGWILGGRAIKDVRRVPLDPADAPGMSGFHGTTIRFYDPKISAWRSTWIYPRAGTVRRFIDRPDPEGITLECIEPDRALERWCFRDIAPDSYRWISESSSDGGATWVQEEEMLARRR